MKKYIRIIIVMILLYATIHYIRLPDYIMCSSISNNMGTYRTTKLYVIVYKAHFNPVLGDMIYKDFCQMNGTPDRIEMKLYFTKRSIQDRKSVV